MTDRSIVGARAVFCANTLRYLWNFRLGTIEQFLRDGVEVLCIGQGGGGAAELAAMGCEVVELDWKLRSVDPIHEMRVVASIHRALRRFRPAVAFSFTFKANLAVALACRPFNMPYVTNVTGLGTAFLSDRPLHRALRRLYGVSNGGAHTTFFQNPADLELFRQLRLATGRRTAMLPGSGVDTQRFAFAPVDRRVRTFVMIARLIVDKGVIEYLEAARELKAERPDLRFLLVGPSETDGPGRVPVDVVQSYADAVEYVGELADVRPLLAEADCLVLPSYREGMPRTVLEAASMGRIALVSDVEGCRDAIEPGVTGLAFAVRSASAVAASMRDIADREPGEVHAMSSAARRMAEERFSERLCIEPYSQILRQVVSGQAVAA